MRKRERWRAMEFLVRAACCSQERAEVLSVRSERIHPPTQWGPESAGSPENEPHVDDEGNEFKNIDMETIGVNWGVEFLVVEYFHRPADGGRTEFIVGNAPHELKSGAPAA